MQKMEEMENFFVKWFKCMIYPKHLIMLLAY